MHVCAVQSCTRRSRPAITGMPGTMLRHHAELARNLQRKLSRFCGGSRRRLRQPDHERQKHSMERRVSQWCAAWAEGQLEVKDEPTTTSRPPQRTTPGRGFPMHPVCTCDHFFPGIELRS
jgi:hypothetical protein